MFRWDGRRFPNDPEIFFLREYDDGYHYDCRHTGWRKGAAITSRKQLLKGKQNSSNPIIFVYHELIPSVMDLEIVIETGIESMDHHPVIHCEIPVFIGIDHFHAY